MPRLWDWAEGERPEEIRIAYLAPQLDRMGSPQAALAEVASRVAKSHDVTAFTSVGHDWQHLCPSVPRVRGLSSFGLVDYLKFVLEHASPLQSRPSGSARHFDVVHSTILSTAFSNGGDYLAGNVVTSHFCQREALLRQLDGSYYASGGGRVPAVVSIASSAWRTQPSRRSANA